jgi:hypothetical protein
MGSTGRGLAICEKEPGEADWGILLIPTPYVRGYRRILVSAYFIPPSSYSRLLLRLCHCPLSTVLCKLSMNATNRGQPVFTDNEAREEGSGEPSATVIDA